jgi:cytochrome b6-f complex iron-sulfur subunit
MAVERVTPPGGEGTDLGRRGPAGAATGRRSFLRLAWLAVGVAALGEAASIIVSFLRPRRQAPKSGGSLVVAGPLDAFAPDSVTAFPAGKFYLVRLPDGGFLALHRRCTHLGCTVPWDEASGRFACPCHASAFDLRGEVLAPPAPRPLDLFPVRIENGIVKVDVSAPIRRSAFDPSQVTRG